MPLDSENTFCYIALKAIAANNENLFNIVFNSHYQGLEYHEIIRPPTEIKNKYTKVRTFVQDQHYKSIISLSRVNVLSSVLLRPLVVAADDKFLMNMHRFCLKYTETPKKNANQYLKIAVY